MKTASAGNVLLSAELRSMHFPAASEDIRAWWLRSWFLGLRWSFPKETSRCHLHIGSPLEERIANSWRCKYTKHINIPRWCRRA